VCSSDLQESTDGQWFSVTNNTGETIQGKIMVNPGSHKYAAALTLRPSETKSVAVPDSHLLAGTNEVAFQWKDTSITRCISNWNGRNATGTLYSTVDLSAHFNDAVTNIFKNQYLSPRVTVPTLQLPTQGIGNWCYPLVQPNIDDGGLRQWAGAKNEIRLPQNIPFATPGEPGTKNIVFTSLWDNYPDSVLIPITGKARHCYLLMAGSTNAMQSRMDNGIVMVEYQDGTTAELKLTNPDTWWPIEQDYYDDGYAFTLNQPVPPRVLLKTGTMGSGAYTSIKGFSNRAIDGGSATVLDICLDKTKPLKAIKVKALCNEVVIGLMGTTLVRERE
jgi:hypothetical protein